MSAVLTLGDQHLPIQPGARTVLTVTVYNDGPSMAELGIQVEGAAGPFATIDPPQLTLFPGAVNTVTVAFAVPADGSIDAGPLPFTVWAIPVDGDGAPAAAADGTLDVVNGSVEPVPPPISPPLVPPPPVPPPPVPPPPVPPPHDVFAAPGPLAESSEGWTPVDEIAAPAPFPPPGLPGDGEAEQEAEADGVGSAALTGDDADAEPPPLIPPLPPYSPPPPYTEETTWRRRELPRSLAGMAAAFGLLFLAMLLIASLLWLIVGKDRVRSIAREEASASGRPGGGVAGTERPIAGRLFLTGPGEVAFTVPKDRYLQVTDIVLQNPAGNTGALRVRRDDAVLIEVALENFRDLDYHFVTPIELGPTNRLILEAACTSPPSAEGSGCTPSALFSGIFSQAP